MRTRSQHVFGSLLLVLGAGLSSPSVAGWPPEGRLVCTACRARLPYIISDREGGAYVIWTEARNYAISGEDLYMQRITASGDIAPGWPADGVAVSVAPDLQGAGHRYGFVLDGIGGVVIAWQDARDLNTPGGTLTDIYAQRVLGDGSIAPGWPVNGLAISRRPGNEALPALLPDGTGGVFVTWDDSTNPDIYLTHITSNGQVAASWPAEGVPICTLPSFQGGPRLAPDGAGGVFIVWGDLRDGSVDQYAQRVTSSGSIAPGWPGNGLRVVAGRPLRGGLLPDGAGGAYIGSATQGFFDDDYYLNRFTADGSNAAGWPEAGAPVCLASDERGGLRMELDGAGGVLLVWQDYRDFGDDDVFALRVRADGTLAPGWPVDGLRVTDNTAQETYEDLAPDGLEGVYLCWDQVSGGPSDPSVFVQHLKGDGSLAPGWPAN